MVFVVMAVQYNSLIDPLAIILTVPLALSGGILRLYLIPFSENSVTLRIGQTPFAPTWTFPCVALILEIGITCKVCFLILFRTWRKNYSSAIADGGIFSIAINASISDRTAGAATLPPVPPSGSSMTANTT